MNRKLTSGTRKHLIWVSLIMILLFVSLIILQWWIMALGLLIITMINLFKELGKPLVEKRVPSTGSYSDRVFNKSIGESIVFPVSIEGTNIVAMTYKDDSEIGVE